MLIFGRTDRNIMLFGPHAQLRVVPRIANKEETQTTATITQKHRETAENER